MNIFMSSKHLSRCTYLTIPVFLLGLYDYTIETSLLCLSLSAGIFLSCYLIIKEQLMNKFHKDPPSE